MRTPAKSRTSSNSYYSKGSFYFTMIDISLFWNHSPSEWFSRHKKTPAERKHVLAGVGFVTAAVCDASREGTVSGFDGVVAVVDTNDHGMPRFLYVVYTVIYLQSRKDVPSRVAMRINKKARSLASVSQKSGCWLYHYLFRSSLYSLPFTFLHIAQNISQNFYVKNSTFFQKT